MSGGDLDITDVSVSKGFNRFGIEQTGMGTGKYVSENVGEADELQSIMKTLVHLLPQRISVLIMMISTCA